MTFANVGTYFDDSNKEIVQYVNMSLRGNIFTLFLIATHGTTKMITIVDSQYIVDLLQ